MKTLRMVSLIREIDSTYLYSLLRFCFFTCASNFNSLKQHLAVKMKFKTSHSPEPEVESPMGPEPEVEAPMGELWFEFAAVHSPLSTEPPVSDLDFLSLLLTSSSHFFYES